MKHGNRDAWILGPRIVIKVGSQSGLLSLCKQYEKGKIVNDLLPRLSVEAMAVKLAIPILRGTPKKPSLQP